MKTSHLSIIREGEYAKLSQIKLSGLVLDVGGDKHAGYHKLFEGNPEFFLIDFDPKRGPDLIVDIEKPFPIESDKFDNALCLNVLEHVYEFDNVVSEMARVVKSGGKLVIATPFMYQIHGSPDDYLRYTASALRRMATKHGLRVESIDPLGTGFFSVGFQALRVGIPKGFLWQICKGIASILDSIFTIIPGFKRMSARMPLGYVSVFIKP